MKKLLIILSFLTQGAFAQIDSLIHTADTLTSAINLKIDSVEKSFSNQIDSLKESYGQTKSKIELLKNSYQQKIDSLSNLKLSIERSPGEIDSLSKKLSAEKYSHKIDSLTNQLAQVQQKAIAKTDSIKSQVTEKIKSLNLPPEAEERISKFTASVDKLNMPSLDAEIGNEMGLDNKNVAVPGLATPASNTNGILSTNLPNTNINAPSVTMPSNDIRNQLNGITGKAEGIQQQIQEGMAAEKIEQTIESNVSQLDQVKAIQDQTMPEVLPSGVPKTSDEAKEQLKDMAKKEAVNHFAGKEAALQQAMDKMSKYKQKYKSVTSIKDLPRKAPNPMKEKSFMERLVPEVSLQMLMKDNFMMDIAPYVGYRFTERLTVGAGWNQRASFESEKPNSETNVYGLRLYGELKAFKGLSGRLELETMNSYVTQGVNADNGHREWVPAVLAGLKQRYTIYKNLRGTGLVLYNFYNPDYKSPYGDRISARIGFEYVIKKKRSSDTK